MDTNLDQRNLAAVFRRLDNTIHRVNHYPVDKCWQNKPCYPLERYPSFKQPWPDDLHVTSSQSLSNQSVAVCCQLHSFVNYIIFCYCFKSLQSAAHFSLDDQFKNDCYFFDALCRQNDLQGIFRSKVQLYPPDLVKTTSGLEHKK